MDLNNESAEAEADDFDLTAALSAEFDKAEGGEQAIEDTPAKVEESPEPKAEGDRSRDEKGRFAKTEAKEAPEPQKAPEAKAGDGDPGKDNAAAVDAVAQGASPTKPPPGWSPTAKMAFNELPADHPIRQAVAQREIEIDKGFAKLAEYKPLDRYVDMAKQSGTTLDRALESYTAVENELRRDFVNGISGLSQRQGIHPVALANAILARHGGSPQQGEAGQQQPYQNGPAVDLTPIQNKLSALESYIEEQRLSGIYSQIDRFANDPKNLFYQNVEERMIDLITAAKAINKPVTLEQAYETACWENPEIRALLIKQQSATVPDASAKAAAAAQARQASKSITGSPVPGAGGKGPSQSLEDEIRDLMNAGAV